MFDFVEKNKKFVQILLGLVILALAIGVGLQGYNAFSEPYLIKVGNTKITERDIVEAAGNRNLTVEERMKLLDQLVQRQLVLNKADDLHLEVSEQVLDDVISNIPAFMENGKFSPVRYEAFLSAQQKTALQYRQELTKEIRISQFLQPLVDSSFVSQTILAKLNTLLGEKREVNVVRFSPQALRAKVQVDKAEAKKYYDAHKKEFQLPREVRVEYIVLAQAGLAQTISVSEKEIENYQKKRQQNEQEERRARHILFSLPKDADAKAKAKLKSEALQVLNQLKANPKKFAALAKQYSQDPGSANKGGDLGFFKQGVMVPAFDQVVFSLKPGEISHLVETPFGIHIIQLEEIHKSQPIPKEQAILAVKREKANQLFMEEQTKLNEALSMAKNLSAVASTFHLGVQKSDWLSQNTAKDSVLNHENVRSAIFSDEVFNRGYNTELIEIQPGVLLAARVIEKKAERQQTFEETQALIVAQLKEDKALKLSIETGKKALFALESGHALPLAWSSNQVIDRALPDDMRKMFRFTQSELPAYVGVELSDGYAIYRVNKILPAPKDITKQKATEMHLMQFYGQRTAINYLQALQKQTSVDVAPTFAEQ